MLGERKRILVLILIMALVALTVTGLSIFSLYRVAFEQQEAILCDIVKSRARLFEAMIRSESVHHKYSPTIALAAALAQMDDASESFPGIGLTGEFVLAQRKGDSISFILRRRWDDRSVPKSIPFNSSLAEPIQQALLGYSGTMVGLDYRGILVLAAFEPINVGGMGMVAKINMTEVRAPYIRAGLVSLGLTLMFIIGGTILFYQVSGPLLAQLQSRTKALEKEVEDRARSEKESQQRRAYVESIFRAAPIGIGVVVDRVFSQVNNTLCAMTGFTQEELLGRSSRMLYPSDEEYASVGQIKYAQIKDHGVGTMETAWQRKDGIIRHILLSSSPLDASDWSKGVTFTALDITERKMTEEALRSSQQILEGIINAIPVRVFWKDKNLVYKGCNAIFARDAGFADPKDIVGKNDLQMTWRDQAELYRNDDRQVIESGTPKLLMEEPQTTPGGDTLTLLTSKIPLRDSEGEICGVLGTYIDITERKQMEESLCRAEHDYRDLFFGMIEGFAVHEIITDSAGNPVDYRFLSINPAFERLTGLKAEQVIGRTVLEIMPETEPAWIERYGRVALTGEPTKFEHFSQELGKHFQVMVYRNKPGQFAVSLLDMTEHRALEEKLRQTQKMEGIGQLAGGIAHDFNNMLSPILGYTEMLLESISPKDPRHGQLKDIQTAANRAKDLTRQLLAFGRKQLLAMKTIDVNLVIQGFERILRRTIREDVAIEYSLDRESLTVTADPGQIEQILMNLAVNAQDAMPQGGTLNIETSLIFLDEDYAKRHPSIIPGPHVIICVSDTGVGMAESTLAQVFDPFFTTKEVGQGTGLGLATVHGIVNQHKGSIWVYSEPGQGTTFKIYLPFTEEAPSQTEKEIDAPAGTGSGETVLVVEDNHMVRNLAVTILKSKGYNVLTAASPDECLVFMADKITQVNLLLTDVVMPGMNGRELYDQLKNSYPKLKVIFMSGYSKNVIAHHGVLDQGVVFISKPFSVLDLTSKVREVLDS